MALDVTANVSCSIAWAQRDTNQNTNSSSAIIITDVGSVSVDEDLTSGSGSQQSSQVFHEVRTLASGGSYEYDLWSLTRSVYGSTLPVSFSGGYIRLIQVQNTSEDTQVSLKIAATGATGFTYPFKGTGSLVVAPKSPGLMANVMDGWQVTSDKRTIQVINQSASGVTYSIGIIGTSGA